MNPDAHKLALKDLPWPISKVLNCDGVDASLGVATETATIPMLQIPRKWEEEGIMRDTNQSSFANLKRLPFSKSKIDSESTPSEDVNFGGSVSTTKLHQERVFVENPVELNSCSVEAKVDLLEGLPKIVLDEQLQETAKDTVDLAFAESHVWVNIVQTLDSNKEAGRLQNVQFASPETPTEDNLLPVPKLITGNCANAVIFSNQEEDCVEISIQERSFQLRVDSSLKISLSDDLNSSEIPNWINNNKETQTVCGKSNTKEVHVQTNFLQFGRRSISTQDLMLSRREAFYDPYDYVSNGSKYSKHSETSSNSKSSNGTVDSALETFLEPVLPMASSVSVEVLPEIENEQQPQAESSYEVTCDNGICVITRQESRSRRNQYSGILDFSYSNLDFGIETEAPPSNERLHDTIIVAYTSLPNIQTLHQQSEGDHEASVDGPVSDTSSSVVSCASGASSGGSSGYFADDERSQTSMEEASETGIVPDVSSAGSL